MANQRSSGQPAARIRARDVDRTAVRDALDAAFSDGQLTAVEHRKRVEAAQSARTLGDLDRLVRDLQAPPSLSVALAPAAPPPSSRWIVALAAAVVVVCGIVVVTSNREQADPTVTSASAALLSAEGLGRMLDDIDRQLDGSEVDRLVIYPGYASISLAAPGSPGREQTYRYEDGELVDNGGSPGRTAGVPVDLAELRPNVPRLIGLLYGADRTLGVSDPTRVHLIAERDDDNGPVVSINLSNENSGADGFLTVGFDGEVRSVYRADR